MEHLYLVCDFARLYPTPNAASDVLGYCLRRSMSRGRALSVAEPRQGSGLKDSAQKNKAVKMGDRAQRRAGKARSRYLYES